MVDGTICSIKWAVCRNTRLLFIGTKEPYTQCSIIHLSVFQGAPPGDIYLNKRSQHSIQRAIYSIKRATYSTKRAIYSTKRAIYSTKRAIYSIKRAYRKSPMIYQKPKRHVFYPKRHSGVATSSRLLKITCLFC